jgi:hypothetical protein
MDRRIGALGPASAGQSENERAAEIRLDAVVMDPQMQTMADQPAWNGIKDVAAHEARRAGHADRHGLPGHRRRHGQRPQDGTFGVDHGGMPAVVLTDDAGNESAIGIEIIEHR